MLPASASTSISVSSFDDEDEDEDEDDDEDDEIRGRWARRLKDGWVAVTDRALFFGRSETFPSLYTFLSLLLSSSASVSSSFHWALSVPTADRPAAMFRQSFSTGS